MCQDCFRETDELDDEQPRCKSRNRCKHLEHEKAVDLGLRGHPWWYIERGGLLDFWDVSEQIMELSDYGAEFSPSVSAASFWTGECSVYERDFWECLALRLGDSRRSWIKARKKRG